MLEDWSAPPYRNAKPWCPMTSFFSHKRRSSTLFVFPLVCFIATVLLTRYFKRSYRTPACVCFLTHYGSCNRSYSLSTIKQLRHACFWLLQNHVNVYCSRSTIIVNIASQSCQLSSTTNPPCRAGSPFWLNDH